MHTGKGVYVGGVGKFQGCPYRSRKWGYMKTIQLSNYPTIQLSNYSAIQLSNYPTIYPSILSCGEITGVYCPGF